MVNSSLNAFKSLFSFHSAVITSQLNDSRDTDNVVNQGDTRAIITYIHIYCRCNKTQRQKIEEGKKKTKVCLNEVSY